MAEKIPQFEPREKPLSLKKGPFSYWALLEPNAEESVEESIRNIAQRKNALELIQKKGWETFEDFDIHGIKIDSIAKGSRKREGWWERYSVIGLSEPKAVETINGRIKLTGPLFGDSPEDYKWQATLAEESLDKRTFFTLRISLLDFDEKKGWATDDRAEEILNQIEKHIKENKMDVSFPGARSLGQAALKRAIPEIFKEIKKFIWEKCYPEQAIKPEIANLKFKMDTEISQELDQIREEEIITGLENRQFDEKIFYYGSGAESFLEILKSPEYKLANLEVELIKKHLEELVPYLQGRVIHDLGAANALKAVPLLQKQLETQERVDYVPVDINPAFVFEASAEINNSKVNIEGKILDFTQPLKGELGDQPKLLTLLGSTLGNGDEAWQQALLKNISQVMTKDDSLMVGVSLKTDLHETLASYDTPQGRNFIMATIKNLGVPENQIELKIVADEVNNQIVHNIKIKNDLTVKRGEHEIDFKQGEIIKIFVSQKYEVGELEQLAQSADLAIDKSFFDSKKQWELAVLRKQ